MQRFFSLTGVVLTSIILLAVSSRAQPGPGRGGGMHYGMMWDAKTMETVTGEVVVVDKYTPGRGGQSYGLQLTLKTDKETVPVILGPAWYIDQQHFAVAYKDRVEIKGSRIPIQGQATIIAAEVTKDDQTLRLRDEKGIPLWAGLR
jgi:hypothetical protein